MAIQLSFLEPKSEQEYLKIEIEEVRESTHKVRKSLFARHAELSKKYIELHDRLEIIERHICRK